MAEQGRVIQPSFAGGELAPSLYGRLDLGKYQVGLRGARNVFIRPHGGVSNRPGLEFVGETENPSIVPRLITFQFSADQSYGLEFGNLTMRVIRNGAYVVETAKAITAATQTNPVSIASTAHGYSVGDHVFIQGVAGMTELNGRTFRVSAASANAFNLQTIGSVNVDGTGYGAYTSGGTAARVYTVVTPYTSAQVFGLRFVQSADVMYLVHPSHAPRRLSRLADDNWSLDTVTFAPSIAAPTGVAATASEGSGSTQYRYRVTAIAAETGEESLPSATASVDNDLTIAGHRNRIAWSNVTGAEKYVVYKDNLNVYGFIGETGNNEFFDENITQDVSDTPPQARNPFSAAGDYPSAVTFYEQRLVFANTTNNPQTVWMSTSANFENFNVSSPTKDDDAVTVSIYAREVNAVRHMVPLDDLIAFTSSVEWRISGASDPGFITPSSVERRPQSYWGSADVPPLVIGNTILFVQDKGSKVRDFGYSFETDGYQGNDLSILANHLFEGHTVVDWAYAKVPHSVVWVVRDDGVMLSFTYQREHQVWAWARHDTSGAQIESVTAVSEGDEDVVYVVVKRILEGRTARTVERMHSRFFTEIKDAFFVDSGLTYEGAATKTLGGLWHLEGLEVVALANGHAVRGLTVTNGQVTFDFDVTKAHVGLAYTSEIQTLPIDLGSREGSVQGRRKRLSRVVLRVEQSRGIFVGPSSDKLIEYKQRAGEPWGDPIEPVTGDIEVPILPQWDTDGDLLIRQSDPLPLTLLAAMPEVTVGT